MPATDYSFAIRWRPQTVTYAWRVAAETGLLRRLSPILRPLFRSGHLWAMARGEESFRIDRARRHAERAGDAAVPAALRLPPGPTLAHNLRRLRPG